MDIATHFLVSFALVRGLSIRRWPVVVGMLFAGTIADIDMVSMLIGPGAYFAAHRTFTHSIVGTLVIIGLGLLLARYLAKNQAGGLAGLALPIAIVAIAHVLLDLLQSEGVALLWPLRRTRFAMDWLPNIDPWIFTLLIAGILLPELFRLVGSEIGARYKTPRGRNGAIVALTVVALYIGARAMLHSGSCAELESHSYHGESARKVGAYPDTLSILTWHGVVETQSQLCQSDVPVGPGKSFDAERADCLHKPEPSAELEVAEKTAVARAYLEAEPFPRAVVARTQDGYEVVIRSMFDLASGETRYRIAARVLLDSKFAISSESLVWASDIRLR